MTIAADIELIAHIRINLLASFHVVSYFFNRLELILECGRVQGNNFIFLRSVVLVLFRIIYELLLVVFTSVLVSILAGN